MANGMNKNTLMLFKLVQMFVLWSSIITLKFICKWAAEAKNETWSCACVKQKCEA